MVDIEQIRKRLEKIQDAMNTIENYLFMEGFTEREKLLMLKIIYQIHLNEDPEKEQIEKDIQEIVDSLNLSYITSITKVVKDE
ncbi:MAG: hypothetical protein ACPLVI_05955 [Thermoplasmata archaeon]|jgi:transcription termination factor NusB